MLKLLIIFLMLCTPALGQVGAIPAGVTVILNNPGNTCENAPGGMIKKSAKSGDIITLCFGFTGDRSRVNYFRVRISATPPGPYNQWFRLPNDAIGFTFPMKKAYHIFLTTVGLDDTQTVIESPGSNHVEVALNP